MEKAKTVVRFGKLFDPQYIDKTFRKCKVTSYLYGNHYNKYNMKLIDLFEGRSMPCIVVDVQPE
jgi:hypothetical protein